ncbi:aromatic amino acid ammonia-lyase [Salinibius halmophilus]|uniref:aromatic amino acid ammonia-lyase n=1 Tax=Salinibius halmophilus TaxID=1853216 RepID=UPI000E66EAFE|nr:aromatic amino acid ammonia-lyase [Salinibius halmophilus]
MLKLNPGAIDYRLWQQVAVDQSSVSWQPSEQLQASIDELNKRLRLGEAIYGVNTLFGSMADSAVADHEALQSQLIRDHALHVGKPLKIQHVRAALLLRVNSLAQGYSAIRPALLQRYIDLLNAKLIPQVFDLGSIGASGDLVPLATMAAAALGYDDQHLVNEHGETLDAKRGLQAHGLDPLILKPKEGIALINGTSFSTAIAGNVMLSARHLVNHQLQLHACVAEVMHFNASTLASEFQQLKPFPYQQSVAAWLASLLAGSPWVQSDNDRQLAFSHGSLLQDRYSLRCLPQFWSPILEQFNRSRDAVLIEANSVTDNPVIINSQIYHGGHFLAQHIAWAMDGMRQAFSQLSKHMEAQISLLVEPAYSRGLPASLATSGFSVAAKPLQLISNAITPQIQLLANSMTNLFPVHAEQLNQNINSLAFGSANMADQSVDWLAEQTAVFALITLRAMTIRQQQLASEPNGWQYFECLAKQVEVPLGQWAAQQNQVLRRLKAVLLSASQPVALDEQLLPVSHFA